MKLTLTFRVIRRTLSVASYITPGLVGEFFAGKFMTSSRKKRPEWEAALLLTATKFASFGDTIFWEWGKGQGPAIVLLHGWGGRGAQLGKFVEPLTARGFRVIIWDGPAHGESEGNKTNLIAYARAIKEFVGAQQNVVGIVGHSLGGLAASLAVLWGLKIEKLVLISAPSSVRGIFTRFADFMQISPRASKAFEQKIEDLTGVSIDEAEVSQLAEREVLPELLAVHSTDDDDVPFEDSRKFVSLLKNARLHRAEGLGHRAILKDKEIIEVCVGFLGQTS